MNYQYFGIDNKIIIIMVGLPARGKSYTSNSLCRYLTWSGYKCKVFNSGKLRRSLYPECNKAEFFNPDNKNNNLRLEKISIQCFIKMIDWLKQMSKHKNLITQKIFLQKQDFFSNKLTPYS